MVKDNQQKPEPKVQPPIQGPDKNAPPAQPTNNLDAASSAELMRLLAGIPAYWKTLCGSLLTDTENPIDPPSRTAFQDGAYKLLARRDRTGEVGLDAITQILGLSKSRRPYAADLEAANAAAQQDSPRRIAIRDCMLDLQAGGDVKYNTDRLIAGYMGLSKGGRLWWQQQTPEVTEWVAPFASYVVNHAGMWAHCMEQGMYAAPHLAARRSDALKPLLNLLKLGALTLQPAGEKKDAAGADPAAADDAKKKAWDEEAAKLKAEIEPHLPPDGAVGDQAKLKDLDAKQKTEIVLKVTAAELEVKARLNQDATFMRRVASLGESHYSGTQTLMRSLDPVEALADELTGTSTTKQGYLTSRGGGIDPVKQFESIKHFLLAHSSKDPAAAKALQPIRLRAMTHETVGSYVRRLSEAQQGDLWKLTTRGTLEPQLADKLYPSLKSGNAVEVARTLLTMSPDDRAAMGALKEDLLFRTAIGSESMREQVVVDGVTVRPYDLCLIMWGQRPGESKDPGKTGPAEVNDVTDPNDPRAKPLNFNERTELDQKLYNPTIKTLESDLSAADSWFFSGARTDDDDVASHLDGFATKCASEQFVHLIRRGGTPPGQELATKFNAKTGKSIHSLIKGGCGTKTRRAAERVLNISIGSESVGVVGGAITRAGEGDGKKPELEQVLRETPTADGGRSIQQVVHSAAAELRRELYEGLCWNGADLEDVLEIWKNLEKTITPELLAQVKEKSGKTVFVIELLQNAYLEIDGPLVKALGKRLSDNEGKKVSETMGLTVQGSAARLKQAQGDAKPADAGAAARADAETLYGAKAQQLFDTLAELSRFVDQQKCADAKAKLGEYLKISAQGTAAPGGDVVISQAGLRTEKPADAAAGSGLGQIKSPEDYYHLHFGITPKNHVAQVARAYSTNQKQREQRGGGGSQMPAADVASWLGVDPAILGGAVEAPLGGAPKIDDSNKLLVRQGFTEATAADNAAAMWKILHEGGEIRLIEATLYGPYNDEEKRLIRLAFRQLSGGIDWQFYVQQAKYQKAHTGQMADTQRMTVGAEGTEKGKAVSDSASAVVTADAGETDAALALAHQGRIDIKTELSNAVTHKEWNQTLRIIDRADDAQCKEILADAALLAKLESFLDAASWDRVHRVLTGQDGLAVRLESRAHGDRDGTMEGLFGGTHEAGMTDDIKEYVKRLTRKFEAEEMKKAKEANTVPVPELIAMTVAQRVRQACQSLAANPEVAAILDRELSGLELVSTQGLLLSGTGEDSNVAAIASNETDAEKIHAEIKRMQKPERERRLADPQYMTKLSQQLYGKNLQVAINLLQSTADESQVGADGKAPGAQDNLAEVVKISARYGDHDIDDLLAKLVELSPAEHDRLLADPKLMAQVNAILQRASKEKRDIGERVLGYRKEKASSLIQQDVSHPDGIGPAVRSVPEEELQRLAFLQENAISRLQQGASVSWNQLLAQCVEVYKMDFHPKSLNTPVTTPVDGKTGAAPQETGPKPIKPDSALDITLESKLRDGMWNRIKDDKAVKERADDKLKMDRVEFAVKGISDPSTFRVIEQWGAFDDDEAGVEDTLRKASDDHLIKQFTSVTLEKPNGEESLSQIYSSYRTAYDKADAARKANPDPNASKELPADVKAKREAYQNYVIDVSGSFEDLVMNFAGGAFSDDSPTKKDKTRSKVKQRDNEDYLKWREIIRGRIPNLPAQKIAKAIHADDRADDAALIVNNNRSARTQLEFHEDDYTRKLGTEGSGARVAGGKRATVTDTMARYGQLVADSESNQEGGQGIITKEELDSIKSTGADYEKAMKEFTDARAKIASIAGAIVGLIAGAIVTIITGGAGAGVAWMLVAGALSGAAGAAGTALTKEAIQGSEFDFSHEGLSSIAQGAITGMIMAGTTRLAGNMMKSLTGPATMKAQATAMQHILNGTKPDMWEKILTGAQGLGFAVGEGVLSEGLNIGIEAGIAPIDPSLWVHGWDEGVIRARHKVRDHISAAPQRLVNAGIMSALTHSVGAMRGKGGEAGAQPPKDNELPKVKGSLEKHLERMKHNAKAYGKVDDVMVMAFSSFVSQKISAGLFDKPIDWSNPEEQIFFEFMTAWQGLAPNIHVDHRRLVFERQEGLKAQLEKHGDKLKTPEEKAHYISLNPDHAIGEVLTVDQFVAARKGMFEAALGRTEAGYMGKHTLNNKQRDIFEHWCREATDSAEYARRIAVDPLTLDIVKAAADPVKPPAPPPPPPPPVPPVDLHTKKQDEHGDDTKKPPPVKAPDDTKPEVKPPTIDDMMQTKGASEAIAGSTFSGQERVASEPDKVGAEVKRVAPFVAAQFPHGTVEPAPGGNAFKVDMGEGKAPLIIEIRVRTTEGNDVASFHYTGENHAVIEISDKARDKHVERSLADLVTEIRETRKAQLEGKPLPKAGALQIGSKETVLNGNDLGKIGQLKALLRQLENAKSPLNGDNPNSQVVTQLNTDITKLLDDMGLTGLDGSDQEANRRKLVTDKLGDRQQQVLEDRHLPAPPQPERVGIDANHDGVSDQSNVGVAGMDVPNKIPRLQNLPPDVAVAEQKFAAQYEADGGKEKLAKKYMEIVNEPLKADGKPKNDVERKTFATDDAKVLSEDYAPTDDGLTIDQRKAARAKMNLAVHQTANAVAKAAFLMRLDQIALAEGGGSVMITAGGVAAGKGFALENNKAAQAMAARAKVIWDTAGEQNSTELPWVIAEAKKRGLTVEILYVHQRPENSWPRVVSRAQKDGRMVDARLHAESYAEGARNFDAIQRSHPEVNTVIVDVSKDLPKGVDPPTLDNLPKDALTLDADAVQQRNTEYLKKQQGLSAEIMQGGHEQGEAVWGPPEHRAAIAELGQIEISSLPAGTVVAGESTPLESTTYFVTASGGKRMLELLQRLGPDVSVRMFKKGFIVRRSIEGKLHEWYFEFNDSANKVGTKNVDTPRNEHGLPPPNAATVELWGFSGVRKINGKEEAKWTPKEREARDRAKQKEPLLWAGHIGISLDGGKTIIGFTPKPPEGVPMDAFLERLGAHEAFPGILGNDTHIFQKAAEMAKEHGWDTEPVSMVQLVDQKKKMEIVDEAARLSGMEPGKHGFGYSFPLRSNDPKPDGENFAPSNGFPASCVRNCGTFPEKMGVPVPEPTGNVRKYMPELQKWANEDGPKDLREKAGEQMKEEKK